MGPSTFDDRTEHTLAAEARVVTVAELQRLVLAGRGTRRDRRTAERAVVERDVDLDGGVAARIEDLASVNAFDQGHGGSMVPDTLVRPGISSPRTTAARTTTRADGIESELRVQLLRPVVVERVQEHQVGSAGDRLDPPRAARPPGPVRGCGTLRACSRPRSARSSPGRTARTSPRSRRPHAHRRTVRRRGVAARPGNRPATAPPPRSWPTARVAARSPAQDGASPGRPPLRQRTWRVRASGRRSAMTTNRSPP